MCKSFKDDLTGKRFGRLVVIGWDRERSLKDYNKNYWLCKCDCSDDKIISVDGRLLKRGHTKSCGCYFKETRIIIGKNNKRYNIYDLSGEFGIGYTLKGEPFYFDLEDYDKIKNYCWHISTNGYVSTRINKKTIIFMHRLIMNVTNKKIVIDHKDHNKKNNRKYNLRKCTQANNVMNRRKLKNNTSGKTGVSWVSTQNKWFSQIMVNNKTINLGYFDNFDDAVKARKDAEIKYFGEFRYKKEEDYHRDV